MSSSPTGAVPAAQPDKNHKLTYIREISESHKNSLLGKGAVISLQFVPKYVLPELTVLALDLSDGTAKGITIRKEFVQLGNETGLSETLRKYSGSQKFFLVFLRVIVGWHFLYEGYVKLSSGGWSAAGYLHAAPGPFGPMFDSMASSASMVSAIDVLMSWGLTLAGIALIIGLFTRAGLIVAAIFLVLFYLSNPPWVGVQFMPGEGSYLIVNKNLVELAAVLVLLVFPAGKIWGFDSLFSRQ